MDDVGIDAEISGNFFDTNSTTGDGGAIRLTEESDGGFYSFFMSIRINVLSWHVVKQEIELRMAPAPVPAAIAVPQSGASSGITFELERNTFSENSALRAGGAFSSSIKSTSLQVDVVNSTLAFNEAGTNGGAIDVRYGTRLNLIDSTVACNAAANGGISADGVVVNVINSIVLGNGGGEFAVANGGEIHTAYSIYSREAAGTVATDTHSQYAVLNEVFGKDLLDASDLTAYGTLAISAAGLAFTSGTQVAKVGDDFYFLQDGAWVDMKGNTTTVSRADYIMAAQDSSAANGIVRVETSRGGFNVGAHAMVEISVEVSTEKSYDGTTAAPVDGNGGYIYSVDGIVSTNDGLLIGADRVELEQLEYTDKNAGRDIPLNVKGVLGGFEDGSLYIVTFSGKGDIHKVQLTVTGNTDTQIYNGREHTVNGWSDVTGLVSGDTLQSVAGVAAGTDVGEYDQVLSDAVIVDADGSDMSGNYEISYIDGKLTINPAKVIVTVDAVKTYDGTTGYDVASGNHTVTVNSDESGLLDADDFVLESFEYGGKNVGKYTGADGTHGDTRFSDVFDAKNFEIEYVYTGTINKAALVVSGNTDTQVYNGKEHTVNSWSDVSGLVAGDILQRVSGVAAGTDVGEYDQVLSDAVIVDADGSDMSGNYEISYIDGKLTINPAKVIVTVDAVKTYDGTTGYDVASGNHTVTVNSDESGLLDADDFVLESFEYGGKNVGKYTGADGTHGDTRFSDVFDAKNFEIEYVYTGTINKAALVVSGNTDTQVYNGKEHTVNSWSDVSGLVAGDILQRVSGVAAGTDVGEYDQVLSDA
ncbi:MBG domain-containing protein, partial [Victivallis vadensis]|uniref:MBG domain-containing protein n=1 Tax=Victivallis vadensis TaxID=172901 RepID=UPI00266BD920